jgi:RNA polymerase sigma factor (sigma-70 family)
VTAEERTYIADVAERERGRLLNFIRKRIPDRSDAEDILQDVFYQLLRGFDDIRETERITSWMFTVARNRITDYFRKKKPDHLAEKQIRGGQEEGLPLMLEDIIPSLGRDPEDEMMREMIWMELEKALESMPEDQRDVFIWNEFEDKSFKEISAMTGEGINTLLSRKRYAVLLLRQKLAALYHQL